MHRKPFWAFLDTFIFSPYDPPPSIAAWKYSKYFCHYKGQKSKSLRIVQKSFLDNKKVIVIFHLLILSQNRVSEMNNESKAGEWKGKKL